MKITKSQLKQIIKEELEKLDEIPTWRKIQYQRDGTPHPGLSPGPKGRGQPGYGEGNLTMDDVHAVLSKLEMHDKDPKAIWDEFKDLNNADDLEDKLWQAQAFFGE